MEVASVATCGMDLTKLGVYLKRDDSDICRLVNGYQDVQHAAISDPPFLLQLSAKQHKMGPSDRRSDKTRPKGES